jgi:TAT (twin-arginine translocation) pathway signal sequence/Domain of unknown function (DUF362)
MMLKKEITRRDFIKFAGAATAGLALGIPSLAEITAENETLSRVILIRNQNVVTPDGTINADLLGAMLDEAVTTFFGDKEPLASWRRIIKPEDFVGIKTNNWKNLPTPPQLESAIKNRVLECGVPSENIAISDREILELPVFKKATALINTRPMRAHAWAGVGSLIKNYIMFVPDPWSYHDNSCENIGSIWLMPHVKGRTRLNILVMLTPQFHILGPHHFDRKYVWNYGGLLVGTDPVAVDSVGLKIIQAKRKLFFGEDQGLKPPAHHIAFADKKFRLGQSDYSKIELIKLGWKDNILI